MYRCFFALVLLYQVSFSQIDFSSGWKGDDSLYTYSAGTGFQLDDSKSGHASLFKSFLIPDTGFLEFNVRIGFSPSASNQLKIAFWADDSILDFAKNAFYLKLGEVGNNDGLDFIIRKQGVDSLLFSLGKSYFSSSSNEFYLLLVKKKNDFNFLLKVGDYETGKVINGLASPEIGICILHANYTKSNSKSVSFKSACIKAIDGFRVPQLKTIELNKKLSVVEFSLDKLLFEQSVLFWLSEKADTVFLEKREGNWVVNFEGYLKLEKSQIINFNYLDYFGRTHLIPVLVECVDWEFGTVLITEVMLDSDGATGDLKNGQYIELYNRSDFTVDLKDLLLVVNSDSLVLPEYELLPYSRIVLNESYSYDNSMQLPNWKSLTKNKGELSLINGGIVVAELSYDLSELKNSYKKEGGWSIELKNLNRFCEGFSSWEYSNNIKGGTPGFEDSAELIGVDDLQVENFRIDYLEFLSDSSVKVLFNRSPDNFSNQNLNLKGIQLKSLLRSGWNSFEILFQEKMKPNEVYSFSIKNPVFDCLGNELKSNEVYAFGLPSLSSEKNLLINELLFNPKEKGVPYVELYNNGSGFVDLSKVLIGDYDASRELIKTYPVTDKQVLLPFNSYLCLSENSKLIREQFQSADSARFFRLNKLPMISSKEGLLSILNRNGEVLDLISYSDSFHTSGMATVKGVAIERRFFDENSLSKNNWTSAKFSKDYGTPGEVNSCIEDLKSVKEGFCFDSDYLAFDHPEVLIHYELAHEGYFCDVNLFDVNGVFIDCLYSSVILSKKGSLVLSLTSEVFNRLISGIYLVKATATHTDFKDEYYLKNVSLLK